MKRKTPKLPKRNPVAKAVVKLRPLVVPSLKRKKLADAQKRDVGEAINQKDD